MSNLKIFNHCVVRVQRCCGARMWDGVTGPLTWRQFHRLAGRGNEDLCEPQPVPPLLVGHERDWLALAPYALRHWERLQLEPYSYPRDVAYAVLAPASEALQVRAMCFRHIIVGMSSLSRRQLLL